MPLNERGRLEKRRVPQCHRARAAGRIASADQMDVGWEHPREPGHMLLRVGDSRRAADDAWSGAMHLAESE